MGSNDMELDFNGKRVLVLEDNGITAAELAYSLEAANAVVLGPFARLEDAEDRVVYSQLAVLDIDIPGAVVVRDCRPPGATGHPLHLLFRA